MRGPRHISKCIDEWLDDCPFNLPDAIRAAREELEMYEPIDEANKAAQVEVTKAKEVDEGKRVRDMDAVLESHRSEERNAS